MSFCRRLFSARNLVLVVVFLCGCSSTKEFAQIPTTVPGDIKNKLEYLNNTYKLDPPDVVEIRVMDNPDLNGQAIVRPDGNITFPLLGDVYVAGHTPLEVREKLWKLLSTYIRELPLEAIEVQVVGFNSKKIFVYSERTGIRELPYTGGTTVLNALAQSGLLSSTSALKDIKVVRATNHDRDEPKMLEVNLDDILKEGDGERNIILQENDVVYIPNKLLAKVGFLFQDVLSPMRGLQGVGSFVESSTYNALGFAGAPQGWQGFLGQQSTSTGTNIRSNSPLSTSSLSAFAP